MWSPDELVELCKAVVAAKKPDTGTSSLQTRKSFTTPMARVGKTDVFPLLSLPLDILVVHLPTHLPPSAILALKLTSPSLYTVLQPPKFEAKDSCERDAVLGYLEEGKEVGRRKQCLVCRAVYPIDLFTWTPEPSHPRQDVGVGCEEEFENRICRWHRGRFERLVQGNGTELRQGWALEMACMHCGGVLAWGRCRCGEFCRTCWKREVWCYTRVEGDG